MSKASSLGLREVRIHMGMFDFTVLVITGDYEKALRFVAWKFEEEDLNHIDNYGYEARGKTFMRGGYVPVIWIPRRPVTAQEHGTLAHEAVHAVKFMFQWAGVSTDEDEVFGHAVGHIVAGTLTGLRSKVVRSRRNQESEMAAKKVSDKKEEAVEKRAAKAAAAKKKKSKKY